MNQPMFPLGPLQKAVFVQRDNRFRAEVELDGQRVKVHVPNSGRMRELLIPGAAVWVQPASGANRQNGLYPVAGAAGGRLCVFKCPSGQ